MPIREITLKKHSETYIVMDSTQTIGNALQHLQKYNYQANKTYLIFSQMGQEYQVTLFSDLQRAITKMKIDNDIPLYALPISLADQVVSIDIKESGQVILDWVASHPQSTLIVTEDDEVIGLFANPNRSDDSGLFDWLSLPTLHGKEVPLNNEPRAKLGKESCPNCEKIDYARFDPKQKTYLCRHCGQVMYSDE